MALKLKPVGEQVIVLTGATSGIGLVTARMAGKRGAKLVLISRNEEALSKLTWELISEGANAGYVVADVADDEQLRNAADEAIKEYGRIDTWINDAGVSIYGKLMDVPHEDSRRLFETNFWGVVNGSVIAVKHLRANGGALINIGSTVSDRAIPVQGMYSASKHAVKGFTDALRMELEAENAPISVTLVKPSAIDTPYTDHAKNFLGVKLDKPAPVYSPETVAETILHCAENVVRDVFVGGGGKAAAALANYAPRLTDLLMENTMFQMQSTDQPQAGNPLEGLYSSKDARLEERGGYEGHIAESSIYTKASLHPLAFVAALALGIGSVIAISNYFREGNGRLTRQRQAFMMSDPQSETATAGGL
jgi:short-subunit dehydrogenase